MVKLYYISTKELISKSNSPSLIGQSSVMLQHTINDIQPLIEARQAIFLQDIHASYKSSHHSLSIPTLGQAIDSSP
jgi:hypothetical protein